MNKNFEGTISNYTTSGGNELKKEDVDLFIVKMQEQIKISKDNETKLVEAIKDIGLKNGIEFDPEKYFLFLPKWNSALNEELLPDFIKVSAFIDAPLFISRSLFEQYKIEYKFQGVIK